ITEPIKSFAFITPFLLLFSHDAFEIIVTDATYNTNTLKYELYGIMGVIDKTAFSLSYCLVATDIIGVNNVKVFLTDKDMVQISAAVLHIKRAIEQHLSSKKQVIQL
ncbi:hypothetical protein C1645_784606, partial [Glomus cerebriforme]